MKTLPASAIHLFIFRNAERFRNYYICHYNNNCIYANQSITIIGDFVLINQRKFFYLDLILKKINANNRKPKIKATTQIIETQNGSRKLY